MSNYFKNYLVTKNESKEFTPVLKSTPRFIRKLKPKEKSSKEMILKHYKRTKNSLLSELADKEPHSEKEPDIEMENTQSAVLSEDEASMSSQETVQSCWSMIESHISNYYPKANLRVHRLESFQEESIASSFSFSPFYKPTLSSSSLYKQSFKSWFKPSVESYFAFNKQKSFQVLKRPTLDLLHTETPKEPLSKNQKVVSFDEFMSGIPVKPQENPPVKLPKPKSKTEDEISKLKHLAIQKEQRAQKRRTSAILIQKWVRGWIVRKEFKEIWNEIKTTSFETKLADIAARIKRTWAPYKILSALKLWQKKQRAHKKKMFKAFLNFTAEFIQKYWRGYLVRKITHPLLSVRKLAKAKILSLILGWKTRRLLKTKVMKNHILSIRDMISLQKELQNSSISSKELLVQISNQLPEAKYKFTQEFYKYFREGSWVNLVTATSRKSPEMTSSFYKQNSVGLSFENSFMESSFYHSQEDFLHKNDFPNKEELPIKPLQTNFFEILDELPVEEEPQKPKPKKKFTNFLKKGTRNNYNPKKPKTRKSPEVQPEVQPELHPELHPEVHPEIPPVKEASPPPETPKKIQPKKSRTPIRALKTPIRQTKTPVEQEETPQINTEETTQTPNQEEAKPRNFLKRKSKAVKPKKIKWEAKSRVDCWVEKSGSEKKEKKQSSPKRKPKEIESFESLEGVFLDIIQRHESAQEYFAYNKANVDSSIPMLDFNSYFVAQFCDDVYQEIIESLENEYSYLTTEEYFCNN